MLRIDGAQTGSLTGVDNDTRRVDRMRLGAICRIDAGTRGTCHFYAFEARRQTDIGTSKGDVIETGGTYVCRPIHFL